MLIPEDLLLSYGAKIEYFEIGDVIFREDEKPKNYYQIISGRIKLNHYNEEGKELILAVLHHGLSVCELLLFIDYTYPVNAIAIEPAEVIKLPKAKFIKMLDDHPKISRDINKFLAETLYHKFIMLENNSSLHPDVRLLGVFDYHKSFNPDKERYSFEIPLTRQQLASLTGLRVETVIRTIKVLEKQNVVKIVQGKIYY